MNATHSSVSLPPHVWFDLNLRISTTLSAALFRESSSDSTTLVNVIATDEIWDLLKLALDRKKHFWDGSIKEVSTQTDSQSDPQTIPQSDSQTTPQSDSQKQQLTDKNNTWKRDKPKKRDDHFENDSKPRQDYRKEKSWGDKNNHFRNDRAWGDSKSSASSHDGKSRDYSKNDSGHRDSPKSNSNHGSTGKQSFVDSKSSGDSKTRDYTRNDAVKSAWVESKNNTIKPESKNIANSNDGSPRPNDKSKTENGKPIWGNIKNNSNSSANETKSRHNQEKNDTGKSNWGSTNNATSPSSLNDWISSPVSEDWGASANTQNAGNDQGSRGSKK